MPSFERPTVARNKTLDMSPAQIELWLAKMKRARRAKSDAEAARLLHISYNSMVRLKARGADHRTLLACLYLLHCDRAFLEGIRL